MKKIFYSLCITLIAVSSAEVLADDYTDAIFQKMLKAQYYSDLRADIKTSGASVMAIYGSYRLMIKRPDKMKIDMSGIGGMLTVKNGSRIMLRFPNGTIQRRSANLNSADGLDALSSPLIEDVKRKFGIEKDDDATNIDTGIYGIKVTPLSGGPGFHFTYLINLATGVIDTVYVYGQNNKKVSITKNIVTKVFNHKTSFATKAEITTFLENGDAQVVTQEFNNILIDAGIDDAEFEY